MKPNKVLGQNFLKDRRIIAKIINTAKLTENDIVLEVGPGQGALTKEIAKKSKKVIAVEKDERAVDFLEKELKDFDNIELVRADILKYNKTDLLKYKVISNLPFYAGAPIIRMFLEDQNPPKQMTLVVQKEVARKICAKDKLSLLAVSVQFYAEAKLISPISKKAFWPRPKVDAGLIQLTKKESPKTDKKRFFQIVKMGFAHPRKQLAGNLSKALKIKKEEVVEALQKNGVNPKARAENLSVKDWIALSNFFVRV